MNHGLLRYVARLYGEEFRSKFEQYLSPSTTAGLRLAFNPVWEEITRARFGNDWPYRFLEFNIYGGDEARQLDLFKKLVTDTEPLWKDYRTQQRRTGGEMPIEFHIYFRSDEIRRKMVGSNDMPPSFQQFGVVADVRPKAVAMLALNPRDQVGQKSPATNGTLGGFLRDSVTGDDYIITCAHVCNSKGTDLYHPAPSKSSSASVIGRVIYSNLPPPSGGARCNYSTGLGPNSLDLSAIRVDSSISVSNAFPVLGWPNFISPVSSLRKTDKVSIFGERSGRVDAEVAMYSIFDEVEVDGTVRCFSDIFTMTHPRPYYLNTNIIKSGDSGGWVLANRDGLTCWDGMVFASDGATAYACYAENIFNQLRSGNPNLILPP